ncbi:MAG: hypothetical protein BWX50_01613 [Euryarchaeota archaeon ADurb.Bin009]|nr:MAG: hypothetical protein BWX50_01613 [Euryarchaeota archaeon ADurb.Bin009]
MVGQRCHAVGLETGRERLGPIPRRGIDDTGAGLSVLQAGAELCIRVFSLGDDGIPEVLPVEAPDVDRRVCEIELPRDIVADVRRRGRRQGDRRHAGETLLEDRKRPVLRPELVPPHRYAVRLVDRYQRDGEGCDESEEVVADRLLRRDVEDLDQVLFEFGEYPACRSVGPGRVQRFGADPACLQVVDLVLHQGDERRYHERNAVAHDRRDLVAERFAPSGRKHRKDVAPGKEVLDNLPLVGVERRMPEVALQDQVQAIHHSLLALRRHSIFGRKNPAECSRIPAGAPNPESRPRTRRRRRRSAPGGRRAVPRRPGAPRSRRGRG